MTEIRKRKVIIEMKLPICPKCKSGSYARERRPNGYTTCKDCGYKALSTTWDEGPKNGKQKDSRR